MQNKHLLKCKNLTKIDVLKEVLIVLQIKSKHGYQLLELLMQNPHGVSLSDLRISLNLSRRTIFYTLSAINDALAKEGLDGIINIRNLGYLLPNDTLSSLEKLQSESLKFTNFNELLDHGRFSKQLNKDDRYILIKWLLISRPTTSINKCNQFFDVSRNTTINDLKIISDKLPKDLRLINTPAGKKIIGPEVVKRRWVFTNFMEIFNLVSDHLTFKTDPKIEKQLKLLEKITGNTLVDDAFRSLTLYIKWLLERITNYPNFQLQNSAQTDTSLALTWANSFLSDENVSSLGEAKFLAEIINTQAFQHINWDNPLIKQLQPITQKMIQRFNQVSGTELPVSGSKLSHDLLIHMVSTYYRAKYKIKYRNPSLNQIKQNYRESFEITRTAAQPFIDFTEQPLSDDELALITVYFSGAIRKLNLPIDSEDGVMVICSSGIGTSQLLITQLRRRYPSVNFLGPFNSFQYENAPITNVRLIISTVKLTSRIETARPLITMPVMPSDTDWQRVEGWLVKVGLISEQAITSHPLITPDAIIDVISNYVRIVDYPGLEKALKGYFNRLSPQPEKVLPTVFDNSFATYIEQEVEWKNATWLAMNPLINNSSIEPSYVSKIIQLTEEHGDYMAIGKGIFLAHAAPNAGVNKLGFSYTLFKHPFYIGNSHKQIKLIIGLAPIDQKKHLKVLGALMHHIQNDRWMNQLNHIHSQNELETALIHSHLIN